jgi:putative addiction module component (TIGR02574 family)
MERLSQNELQQLTPPERLSLIAQLWDSLEETDVPLSARQRDELDRRLESLERGGSQGITWAALKQELEQRCR